MKEKNNFKKPFIIYTLIIFFITSITFLAVSTFIYTSEAKIYKEEITKSETNIINIEKNVLTNKITNIVGDLLYISDTLKTIDSNQDYTEIENLWLAFSKRKKIYDQIRYLDLDGNEIIRVNYATDNPYLTSESDLQNKSNRYYFTRTLSLSRYQLYISKIDLNIENGVIEEPIKPMIRISIPYYDSSDKLSGIIILNYYADNMLKQLQKIASASLGEISVINDDSYWIFNTSDPAKNWGFMYDDRQDDNFKNSYPDEWNIISTEKTGILNNDNGTFNYTSILTGKEITVENCEYTLTLDDNVWYIISHIDPANSSLNHIFYINNFEAVKLVLLDNIFIYVLLFLLSSFTAFLMISKKIEKNRIKYFSEYDAMTDTYNRRAGFDILKKLATKVDKEKIILSVCFIDINGLKSVNDNLGHEKGDELILSVVSGIKENIRKSDYLVRLGGDEFLIIFDRLDEEAAEQIWQRIKAAYQKINDTEKRKYLISASHGIETYFADSNNTLDDIINYADEKMYNEKRVLKKTIQIIRN